MNIEIFQEKTPTDRFSGKLSLKLPIKELIFWPNKKILIYIGSQHAKSSIYCTLYLYRYF